MKVLILSLYSAHYKTLVSFKWRFLQIFSKQLSSIIIFFLCASYLSVSDFGLYSYIVASIFFLTMFCDFGISTATTKFATEYQLKDSDKFKSLISSSLFLILTLALIIISSVYLFGQKYFLDHYNYLLLVMPIIITVPIVSIFDGIYRSNKLYKKLALVSFSVSVASIVFSLIFVKNFGLKGGLLSQNFFAIVSLIILLIDYGKFSISVNLQVLKEVASYSFYIGASVVGYYLFSRIDILVLGHFGYFDEIAVFEILNKLYLIALLPLQIFSQVLFTNFAEFSAKHQYKKIYNKLKKYFFVSLLSSILFAMLAYSLTGSLIYVFFNPYYGLILNTLLIPVILIYSILIYGVIINSAIITSTGYAYLMMIINLILGPLNIVLGLYLVSRYGYIGIIYSNLVLNLLAVIVLHSLFIYKIKRKIQLYAS